jgi:hypothetical protein
LGGGGGEHREILLRLPVKYLELVRVFEEASRNLKSSFGDIKDAKKI